MNLPTDSRALKAAGDERQAAAHGALHRAVLAVLETPHGRLVWRWIHDELCRPLDRGVDADARALGDGRRQVAAAMREVLVEYPEIVARLDADRAAASQENAEFQLILRRLAEAEAHAR